MRRLVPSLLSLAVVALLIATPAMAHDYGVGDLTLDHPWARAAPPAAPVAGGYVRIVNAGGAPDRLVAVTSPISSRIEVHETSVVEGVARMRPVDRLVIAPGEAIVMGPGGMHLMFWEPTEPLRQGDRFPASFVFERAGTVAVEFVVEGMATKASTHAEPGTPKP